MALGPQLFDTALVGNAKALGAMPNDPVDVLLRQERLRKLENYGQ
jgi:hypothetical protein